MSGLITPTADFVKEKLSGESSGHDWWHVYRVWQLAKRICETEPKAKREVVELAALLHDIADWKFHGGDLEAGPKAARKWLESNNASEEIIAHVEDIIRDTSFKGAGVNLKLKSLEAKIVFDADKLDAIGAIGIARTFAYGGHQNRTIYDPGLEPTHHSTFEEYSSSRSHTINHFYEKLLLLKNLMQTGEGKKLSTSRHHFMEIYLKEFYKEWDAKL